MEPPDSYVQKRHHQHSDWDDFGNFPDTGHNQNQNTVPSVPAFYGYGERQPPSVPAYAGGSASYSAAAAPNINYYEQLQRQSQPHQANNFYNPIEHFAMSDPVVGVAAAYGQQFAQQGKETLAKVVPVSKIKLFFAVDTKYVLKKLVLLLLPFFHRDWALHYQGKGEQVAPMFNVNAPDLYIPVMAFVTYVFLSGFVLGTQQRFSPEQLGVLASSAFAWIVFENIVVILSKYVMNVQHAFGFFETLAFIGYKFVGMIVTLVVYLIGGRSAYYYSLGYCALAVTFFLVRSVRSAVLPEACGSYEEAKKRKLYLILFISLTQPFIMWWLTSTVATFVPASLPLRKMPNIPDMPPEDSLPVMDDIK